MKTLPLVLLVVVVLSMPVCSTAGGYVAHPLSAWANALGSDINDAGQIVGTVSGSAVLWNGYDAEPQALANQGRSSSADLINNSGIVVGILDSSGSAHLAVWSPGADATDMGLRPVINAVSNDGTMVGFGVGDDQREVPVSMSPAGQVTYLDTLFGIGGTATAINDGAYIVGTSANPVFGGNACLWHEGDDTIDIGTFGGTWSCALGINNHNQVVGAYGDNEHGIGNFIWTPNGDTVLIPYSYSPLEGYDFGTIGINDNGLVLGQAQIDGVDTVVTWSLAGGLTIVGPGEASAINNSGWIVGTSSLNSPCQAIVWQPVPEPPSVLALLAGLGGFGAMLRRRRR